MSTERHAVAISESPHETLEALDLFALGRQASALRDERLGRRGTFVRTKQLLSTGAWRGPRDAAEAYVEEADLAAVGGIAAARAAGVGVLVAAQDLASVRAAAGLRVLWRVAFRDGETDGQRLARLATVAEGASEGSTLWGVMPAPVGEPYGLDTLRFFALCRLALPQVPHLLA
ncbi:MAG TPA: hypothetical protein VIK30_09125, partial [Polyangia bacterium]